MLALTSAQQTAKMASAGLARSREPSALDICTGGVQVMWTSPAAKEAQPEEGAAAHDTAYL